MESLNDNRPSARELSEVSRPHIEAFERSVTLLHERDPDMGDRIVRAVRDVISGEDTGGETPAVIIDPENQN